MTLKKEMKITLVRSLIGRPGFHRETARCLGLRRIGDCVTHRDSPAVRGMVDAISHLIRVET